jgi:tRNA (guanine-N7-)-methyltransferase
MGQSIFFRTEMVMLYSLLFASSKSFAGAYRKHGASFGVAAFSSPRAPSEKARADDGRGDFEENLSPWSNPHLMERAQGKNPFRSRQHVNPLTSKFQQSTVLTPDWPRDTFDDMSRPLFLDIGCSRGGFLVDIAKQRPDDFNYLGLEIRPIIVHHAQQRVEKHNLKGHLGFVGCNANVDLERLLTLADAKDKLKMVTIQFPDPHFKARHAKRRVVTPELVTALARFMPSGATVFLQSDIQTVLDDMREQFRNQTTYFQDDVSNLEEYLEENFLGIATEREISVLEKGLPVYRTTFTRTSEAADSLEV